MFMYKRKRHEPCEAHAVPYNTNMYVNKMIKSFLLPYGIYCSFKVPPDFAAALSLRMPSDIVLAFGSSVIAR